MTRRESFNEGVTEHNHKYDPLDTYAIPKGIERHNCPACENLMKDINKQLPTDPFVNLS